MRSGSNSQEFFRQSARLALGIMVVLLSCISASGFTQADLEPAKALRSINGKWWNHDSNSYNSPSAPSHLDNPLRKDGRFGEATNSKWKFPNLNLQWLGGMFGYFVVSILVLLLATVIVLLVMHYVRSYRPISDTDYLSSEIKIDPSRIEDLPFEASQWVGDPLTEARKLAQQGRFDEAIIYFYGYQLLALDQSRKIHLHKGKTNRMYLREIEAMNELRELVNLTMDKFEQVFFGKHSLTKQSFLEVWTKLDTFHALIAQSTGQAASANPSAPAIGAPV